MLFLTKTQWVIAFTVFSVALVVAFHILLKLTLLAAGATCAIYLTRGAT